MKDERYDALMRERNYLVHIELICGHELTEYQRERLRLVRAELETIEYDLMRPGFKRLETIVKQRESLGRKIHKLLDRIRGKAGK